MSIPRLFYLLFTLLALHAVGQVELGDPIIQNFTAKDIGGENQCIEVMQASDGLIYVGNGAGVLVYDGARWFTIPIENNAFALAPYEDKVDGVIYVGGVETFGYLERGADGSMRYRSLLDRLDDRYKDFYMATSIARHYDHILILTRKYLFKYDGDTVVHVSTSTSGLLNQVKYLGEEGYFHHSGQVLSIDKQGVVSREVPERFKGWRLIQKNKNGWLVQSKDRQYYALDMESEQMLNNSQLFAGLAMNAINFVDEDLLSWNTTNDGFFVTNDRGDIQYQLDRSKGLISDFIYNVRKGTGDLYWVATDDGLGMYKDPRLVSQFSRRNELGTSIQCILRFQDRLHVGYNNGLQVLNSQDSPCRLTDPHSENFAIGLKVYNEKLFIASNEGFSVWYPDGSKQKVDNYSSRAILRLESDTSLFLVGRANSLDAFRMVGREVQFLGTLPNVKTEIRTLEQDEEGSVWVGTFIEGVLKVEVDMERFENSTVTRYGLDDGLTHLNDNEVFKIRSQMLFATPGGIKEYDHALGRFVPYYGFGKKYGDGSYWTYRLSYNEHRDEAWIMSYKPSEVARVRWEGDSAKVDDRRFRFLNYPIYWAYPEDNGVTWMGGPEGLIRYDANYERPPERTFDARVRQLRGNGDSLLFNGDAMGRLMLDKDINEVQFKVAAAFYELPEEVDYQYQLVGYDPDWTAWAKEADKSYTNLPGGSYDFLVRARNVYGEISTTARFPFEIGLEWYEAFWFKLLVAGAFLSLAYGSVRFLMVRKQILIARRERQIQEAVIAEQERGLEAVFIATEEERKRIAKDLHDGVGQQLSALKRGFETILEQVGLEQREKVLQLKGLVDETAKDTREISHQMMPRALTELGLVPAIEDSLNKTLRTADIQFEFEHFNLRGRYSERKEIAIYRILQELVNNIIKHSGADQVNVQLFENQDNLILIVEDNGRGLTNSSADGVGILNIKNRLNTFKGRVNLEPSIESGTIATISIPVGGEPSQQLNEKVID